MLGRSLGVHAGLMVLAGALALRTFTAEDDTAKKHVQAEVWGGGPDQITMVRFEHKLGDMKVEPRKDKEGRYFVGTVQKDKAAESAEQKPPPNPHDPHAAESAADPAAKAPEPTGERTTAHFIAVKQGEELFKSLAPLQVLRVLGKVDEGRKKDFGFDAEQGSLYVSIGGKDHTLVFGGSTPGGSDHYARDPVTGNAYVVPGTILRDLTSADQRLVERDLHGFEDATVKRIRVTVGEASRELVRSADKKDFWAAPATPDEKDETASNWMSKVERLRVTSYAGDKPEPPVQPSDVVMKIEYFDDRRNIGFLELVRRPGEDDRHEYIARTQHTRWYAGVLRSSAEQVDQDVKSVVGP
jgi:hypothetical protein